MKTLSLKVYLVDVYFWEARRTWLKWCKLQARRTRYVDKDNELAI